MPLGQVIKSATFAAKLLGYGPVRGLKPDAAPVHVRLNAVAPKLLAEARERMQELARIRDDEEESAPAPSTPQSEKPVKEIATRSSLHRLTVAASAQKNQGIAMLCPNQGRYALDSQSCCHFWQ